MLRQRVFLSAAGFSAVAAIASAAFTWPSAVAQPFVRITAKQAALMGVPSNEAPLPEQVVGTIIIKMRASSGLAQAQGAAYMRALPARMGLGFKAMRQMTDESALMSLDAPLTLSEARRVAARLASDPAVEYAEPDVVMKPFAVPNETEFQAKQWYLFPPLISYEGATTVNNLPGPKKTALPTGGANLIAAWDVTKGAATVVVAIIDTGIVNHPELNNQPFSATTYTPGGRFLEGYDFIREDALNFPAAQNFVANDPGQVGRDTEPVDTGDGITNAQRINPLCNDNAAILQGNGDVQSTWHGTHSAGIVAATTNDSVGMAAIGWENIRVVPIRALGRCGGSMFDVADAIRWAAGLPVANVPDNLNPARVILVGAGGRAGEACSQTQTLQTAINDAINAGSVIVAAAGNEGSITGISAPANCSGVIAVTAHTIIGENATYANVGPEGGAGPNPTISAAGGGSGAVLGGASEPTDDPNWDGYRIWSTTPGGTSNPGAAPGPGTYSGKIGTSAAAAQVAGVAALIKSKTPSATPAQIKSAIETSARPFPELGACGAGRVYAGRCGAGMLDATRALQAAGPPFVVTPPANVTVAAGETASFTIEAIGVESYQWIRNGVAIAGATGPTYTTPALAATDNNVAFQVNMSNSFGPTTSPAAVLTVTSTAANSPSSGGGALPAWHLVLLSTLLLAARVRVAYREH